MGIQGLIPFLEKAAKPTNVSDFSGGAVAIDAYCWLHKGVFSCADKLVRGDDCILYVKYCMKFINMLLSKNVKPILVFDGQRLPAKMETELKRRESRELNRKKAAELMRLERAQEAQTYIRRSVDITHEMALNLIRVCRSANIDCIVAPYEADAQLAYLSLQNMVDAVITEDSDLLVFGAKKVLFKMDINGNGLLIEQSKLFLAMNVNEENFSFDKFRYMCILSGCDYLPSLPGIGLAKANRFIKTTKDPDIHRAISRIALHLNMPQLTVTKEYRNCFLDADFIFRHQPVFDPRTRKLVPLTQPAQEDAKSLQMFNDLANLKHLSNDQLEDLAFGNLDPESLKKLDTWKPSANSVQKAEKSIGKFGFSIWDKNYILRIKNSLPVAHVSQDAFGKSSSKIVIRKNDEIESGKNEKVSYDNRLETEFELLESFYGTNSNEISNTNAATAQPSSSVKKCHRNPFLAKPASINNSAVEHTGALSKFARLYKSYSSGSTEEVINSRYFSSNSDGPSFCLETVNKNSNSSTEKCPGTPPKLAPNSLERSPLKLLNNSFVEEYTISKSPLKPVASEKRLEKSPVIKARKRSNPFAKEKSGKRPSCSPSFLSKLASFRHSSHFQTNERDDENGKSSVINDSTNKKFTYPQMSPELVTALITDADSEDIDSIQQSEDEGFGSFGSETSSVCSSPKWQSPLINKTPTPTYRFSGLQKKSGPKQLSLKHFAFKPAPKLKI